MPIWSNNIILEVRNLNVHYGAIHALQGISFHIFEGEIVTLIGANGAGKTTTLKAISGIKRATSGSIFFAGKEITSLPAHKITGLGISHIPEGRKPFANLTVYENLRLGGYLLKDGREFARRQEEIFASFPRLKERVNQMAGTLSGGELQMLAIGRGLLSEPRLLLLDEPSMGLSPILVEEIFQMIKRINERGVSILLVEQNAYQALSVAHRAYVLETGRIVLSGEAKSLLFSPQLKEAYL